MNDIFNVFTQYLADSGFGQLQWPNLVMIGIGLIFITLAIRKGFEPLLLVPIGFGILIGNIPYDSTALSLGVHDGPASESELRYYRVQIDRLYFDGEALSLQQAIKQGRVPEPTNEQTLRRLINTADRVTFASVTPIENRVRALRLIEQGQALMVNSKANYTVGALPDGFEPPGVIAIGQGRRLFVESVQASDRYPQVWSQAKQDPGNASVFYWLYTGVGLGFFPPLIFLGVGALTDFGPLLSNPKTLLLGAAAQFGIFAALLSAIFVGLIPGIETFTMQEAASVGIIGGADGPTAIFVTSQLAPHLLGAVALAAYSYMAMVPIIQPPIMRLLTTQQERTIQMTQLKEVPKTMRIIFPIAGFLMTAFIAPGALPLLGMLFFGNLLRESLVTDRLAKTSQTAFIDIVTILLGITVGAKTSAASFLTWQTIFIFILGIFAFAIGTSVGVLFARLMNKLSRQPVNPLIGAAGVSAVPMAARVAHRVGQEENPQNFLLMHAMGPNVAGVIGSAVAAGVLLSWLAGA
jgi:oxaloacetate decarboxylase beta subunit